MAALARLPPLLLAAALAWPAGALRDADAEYPASLVAAAEKALQPGRTSARQEEPEPTVVSGRKRGPDPIGTIAEPEPTVVSGRKRGPDPVGTIAEPEPSVVSGRKRGAEPVYTIDDSAPSAPAVPKARLPECFNFNVIYSHDMKGQARTVTSNPQSCLERCRSTAGCSYYSWYPDGGCHLQDETAAQGSRWWGWAMGGQAQCESCFSPEMRIDTDLPGSRRTHEKTAAKCQERCAGEKGCAYFTYWHDGGCHLHGEKSVMVPGKGVMAGPRTCPQPA
eukprot:CAMPEP_0204585086 /NCGR_PEP_ID=MMETSP0661-20131031/46717_1 /ASSEMBLY_ACC=CAM_ASM_000606 /TAXON_ID=109239 /ORGANISM="Alexandrium margalefi, Strain AMGDE01CS-322" /LENGTH=277 /DNA_ID=CAMNT_0051594611 /DNA_START=42 /DNA_END=875 /DNA_ORIENTATION=+